MSNTPSDKPQSAAALRIISRFVRRPSSLALMSSIQISSAPSSQ